MSFFCAHAILVANGMTAYMPLRDICSSFHYLPRLVLCVALMLSLLCRMYALFFTDQVVAEPLTDAVHFNDLLHANAGHVHASGRLLKAMARGCTSLYLEAEGMAARDSPLPALSIAASKLPYTLRSDRLYAFCSKATAIKSIMLHLACVT